MADYTSHFEIPYPGATDPRQALDLFIPPQANEHSPLIVFIHGKRTALFPTQPRLSCFQVS